MEQAGRIAWLLLVLHIFLLSACAEKITGIDNPVKAPANVVATAGDSSVQLIWDPVPNADFYHVYWSDSASTAPNSGKPAGTITGAQGNVKPKFTVTQLNNGTTYYFVVTVVVGGIESIASDRVSATPRRRVPVKPINVRVEPGDRVNIVRWSGSATATTYHMYWDNKPLTSKSGVQRFGNISSPFSHTAIENGQTFFYRVTAANDVGESEWSDEVSGTPVPTSAPQAPGNVQIQIGSGELTLLWSNVQGLYYKIYWSNKENFQKTDAETNVINGVQAPYVLKALQNGTTYYFRVAALNGQLEGNWSDQKSAAPSVNPPSNIPSPTVYSITAGDGKLTIQWDLMPNIEGYKLYWTDKPNIGYNQATSLGRIGSPFEHTGLSNGVTYYYWLTAIRANVESAPTPRFSSTPVDTSQYLNADLIRGAQLYDNWWYINEFSLPVPQGDHALWLTRATDKNGNFISEKSREDTYRCVTCHGWDYQGERGQLNQTHPDYNGFPGLIASKSQGVNDLFNFIKHGNTANGPHDFSGQLSDTSIYDLVKFIKEGIQSNTMPWEINDVTHFGQSVFEGNGNFPQLSCAQTACHANPENDTFLIENLKFNPEKFLHKIRFGVAGNRMPGGLSLEQAKLVLGYSYRHLLFSNSNIPEFNATQYESLSEPQILSQWQRGGLLYDRWFFLHDPSTIDTTNQYYPTVFSFQPMLPKFSESLQNTRRQNTWRCQECHGWDYRGADTNGAYQNGSHQTGIKGLIGDNQQYITPEAVYNFLRAGDATRINHAASFHGYGHMLKASDLYALTRFVMQIRSEDNMSRSIHHMIDDARKDSVGDISNGQSSYGDSNSGDCIRCHGENGRTISFQNDDPDRRLLNKNPVFTSAPRQPRIDVAELAKLNPWEFAHKIRYGHAGNSLMTSSILQSGKMLGLDNTLEFEYVRNLLRYAQTSLDPNPKRGGRLYDNWFNEKAIDSPPQFSHPRWADGFAETPRDTWRCVSCHAWNYQGRNNNYRNLVTSSLLTSVENIQELLVGSTAIQALHDFRDILSDTEIYDLSKFLMDQNGEGIQGLEAAISSGDINRGKAIYESDSPGACIFCHGEDGSNIVNANIRQMAVSEPYRFLHKIRFGQAQLLSEMRPTTTQFGGLNLSEAMDVLAFVRAKGNAQNYENASAVRGGRLYDNWWQEMQNSDVQVQAPVSRNPIFDTWNVSRVVSGTEGWRCATCHSFAYSGTGILATDAEADNLLLRIEQRRTSLGSETELQNQIYLWIKEGSGNVHNYGTSQALLPTILSESELWDLTKFLLEAIQVTVDKIDPQSKTILINTDPDVTGAQLYTGQSINTVNCTTCHGISGQQVAGFDIFQLAVDNPWRFVHKTRFSQTVNSKMPALEGIGDVSVEQIYSLLAYARQQFNTR